MQRLEVSCAVRRIYTSLGAKGLNLLFQLFLDFLQHGEMKAITNIKRGPIRRTSTKNFKSLVELFTLPLPGLVPDKTHFSSSVRKVFTCKFKASIYCLD